MTKFCFVCTASIMEQTAAVVTKPIFQPLRYTVPLRRQLCNLTVFHFFVHQIDYPEIAEGIGPRHRFMSAYEQRIEPPDRRWQYLLLAAEPYETIAFKVSGSCTSFSF